MIRRLLVREILLIREDSNAFCSGSSAAFAADRLASSVGLFLAARADRFLFSSAELCSWASAFSLAPDFCFAVEASLLSSDEPCLASPADVCAVSVIFTAPGTRGP